MATFKVTGTITGLEVGQVVSDEEIPANLGGVERLLALKAIEPAVPVPIEPSNVEEVTILRPKAKPKV